MVDIAQHVDGTLHLSYRGLSLTLRSVTAHEHLPTAPKADKKTLNAQVHKARDAQHTALQRLKTEMAFQEAQRNKGIYRPDTPAIVPRYPGDGRSRLRAMQPPPALA